MRVQRPVFLRDKRIDFIFPVGDDAQRHRLYTACAEATLDFFPQNRADLIANHAVQTPAGLLLVHQIHIDIPCFLDGSLDRTFCNFIKCDPAHFLLIQVQSLGQMPGNRFPLTIRVRCQIYFFRLSSPIFSKMRAVLPFRGS